MTAWLQRQTANTLDLIGFFGTVGGAVVLASAHHWIDNGWIYLLIVLAYGSLTVGIRAQRILCGRAQILDPKPTTNRKSIA